MPSPFKKIILFVALIQFKSKGKKQDDAYLEFRQSSPLPCGGEKNKLNKSQLWER